MVIDGGKMNHLLRFVSGGSECNHTGWECDYCHLYVNDIHEHEGGYVEINSDIVAKRKCHARIDAILKARAK